VAGKLMSDIVAAMPNKPVDIRQEDTKVLIQCGSSRFELPTISLEDYPQLPVLPEVTGKVQPQLFSEAVSQVAAAAGKDDTLPMLTGISMAIEGKEGTLTAADRFRLAVRTLEWEPTAAEVETQLLVTAKTLQATARSLRSHIAGRVGIAVGTGDSSAAAGVFGLHAANREPTPRMVDADLPTVPPLLPKAHTAMASVESEPLQEAIRRVALLTERNAQI